MSDKKDRQSRVPTGRVERLARIGWMTGEFALGGAAEGVRRFFGGESDDENAFLSPANAERLALHLSRMRGAAMKIGQMLSLADAQILPPAFAEALAILRDAADTMPESQVRESLVREYGSEWAQNFQEFDFEPIASASIGQVHMAIAKDGRELALKIQYPGVAESIDSDVDNLATALRAARILPGDFEIGPIVEEAKRQLQQEADYEQEADFLERYAACVEGDDRFAVPIVDRELTTPRILAMSRILGVPLEDLSGTDHPQTRRDEMGARLLELLFRELFEFALMQTDPNFSNYLLLPDQQTIGLLDLGSAREIPEEIADHYLDLFRALRSDEREPLLRCCLEMGYLLEEDSPEQVDRFLEMLTLIFEPFGAEGVYEFGRSDYVARAQELGMELVFRHGFLRTPPPETIFLQRKLDGTLMLCSRIKARVDVSQILDRVLASVAAKPEV